MQSLLAAVPFPDLDRPLDFCGTKVQRRVRHQQLKNMFVAEDEVR
jgi:hypothetical protein